MGTLISRQHEDLKKPMIKLGLDILFFIALIIPISIFNLTDLTPPNIRGFFCSDNSIRYPYRKNTVPSLTLFLVGIPVVVAVKFTLKQGQKKRLKRANQRQLNSEELLKDEPPANVI